MRVAVGGYVTFTNSFATQPLGLEQFQRATLTGDTLLGTGRGWSAIAGMLDIANANSWEVVPLQFILPGIRRKITSDAHEYAKESFRSLPIKASPLAGAFLQLHGAAAAEHVDDCEGSVLASVRECVGEQTPQNASLDGQANVNPLTVGHASMLIGLGPYPHSDFVPGVQHADQVMAGMFDGSIVPSSASGQPAMAKASALKTIYIAPGWPLGEPTRNARNLVAGNKRFSNVSLLRGFFCSDIPKTSTIVTASTNREPTLAEDLAAQIKEPCWAKRHAFHVDPVSIKDPVKEAMETDDVVVVLPDVHDSGAAGTPSVGTALPAEPPKQSAKSAVVRKFTDLAAVPQSIRARIGNDVTPTVGGNADKLHGDPIQINGKVRVIQDGRYTAVTNYNARNHPRTATVVVHCYRVVLTTFWLVVLILKSLPYNSL